MQFQGLTCCVFRDAHLQTSVVTSAYLSYCCLSISLNQSGHSPLTSGINKAFSATELPLTGNFLIFWLCIRIPVDQLFLKYPDLPVTHQQPKITFLSHSVEQVYQIKCPVTLFYPLPHFILVVIYL